MQLKTAIIFRTQIVKLPAEMRKGLEIGASVANNGVCLTVTEIHDDLVSFDLMKETLRITNLGGLKAGDFVNIERAMQMGAEIGGHVLSGHVLLYRKRFHKLSKAKIIVRFGLNYPIKM